MGKGEGGRDKGLGEEEEEEGEAGRRKGGGEEGEGKRAELVSPINALCNPSNPLGDEHYYPLLLQLFAPIIFKCLLFNLSPPRE